MPLANTQEALAEKLAKAIATNKDHIPYLTKEWKKIAGVIITHLVENSVITGTADGNPLIDGKIT